MKYWGTIKEYEIPLPFKDANITVYASVKVWDSLFELLKSEEELFEIYVNGKPSNLATKIKNDLPFREV